MRWSNRNDDGKLEALLSGEDEGRLSPALTELRRSAPEAPAELRERIRALVGQEQTVEKPSRHAWTQRFSFAHAGVAVAAFLLVAVAIPAIGALTRDSSNEASAPPPSAATAGGGGAQPQLAPQTPSAESRRSAEPPLALAAPPPTSRFDGRALKAAPLPSPSRAQDYSASIKLHVDDPDELSKSVQSAIRTTRRLGGYVTYVDYGTSGVKDGDAQLSVRVPVGRVQSAIARFSMLGTILEQQTEVRDLQAQIDRITRDVQRRRDRIAKLDAELKDPNLTQDERTRLEARIVQARRGLANAIRGRSGLIRQSRFATLDLAFTTEKRKEAPAPPSELRRTLDDAAGILAAELGVLLYVLIAGAPFIVLGLLAWPAARAARRAASHRVLERA